MGRICLFVTNLMLIFGLNASAQPSDDQLVNDMNQFIEGLQEKIGKEKFAKIREDALAHLKDGDLKIFDPLVGDTSCELRAIMAVLFQRSDQLTEQEQNLVTLVYMLGSALQVQRNSDGFNPHPRGGDNDVDQLFNSLGFKLSGVARKKFISNLQRAVAAGSVLFAREQAVQVCNPSLQDLFQNQCCIDSFGRPVVSCLGICHLLLEEARMKGFPIILRVRLAGDTTSASLGTIVVAFVAGPDGQFMAMPPSLVTGNPTVVVVEATTTYFSNPYMIAPSAQQVAAFVSTLSLENLMILDSVLHPQFAGNVRNTPLDISSGNAIAIEWAEGQQIYTENDIMIHVDHVYPDSLANAGSYNPFDAMSQPAQAVELLNGLYFPAQALSTAMQFCQAAFALAGAVRVLASMGVLK